MNFETFKSEVAATLGVSPESKLFRKHGERFSFVGPEFSVKWEANEWTYSETYRCSGFTLKAAVKAEKNYVPIEVRLGLA